MAAICDLLPERSLAEKPSPAVQNALDGLLRQEGRSDGAGDQLGRVHTADPAL